MPVAVVGFIATLGVPGLVGAAGALTFAGNLLAGAIGLGAAFGLSSLYRQKPSTLDPQAVKSTLRQSVMVRRKHRGVVRTSGGYAFYRTRRGNLYMVMYLGEGPTSAFVEHYIDGRAVTLDADGNSSRHGYNIRIETRRGLVPETHYSSIATAFPEIWGTQHRGDGCISVAIIARGVKPQDFNSIYPNRIPQYESLRRDGIIYDPRTGLSAFTSNLYLIYLDYLRDSDGAGIAWDYFDEDDFSAAATIGDELLPTNGGGTVRRAYGQLSYELNAEPVDIIERLETATDARIYLKSNGKIGIHPGIWVEPTVSIHDGSIVSYEMSGSSGPLREANEITLNYTNPLAGYSSGSCDPWRDESDISASGTRTIPIDAYEIQHHHHGRRVQKLRYCRASARWQGKIITDLAGIEARGERNIFLEIRELGIDFQAFEIEDYEEDDASMTVMMEVRSVGPEMYNLSSAEEGTPPPTPPEADDTALDRPASLVVVGGQRTVSGAGKVAVITANWTAYPDRSDLTTRAEISPADLDQWSPMTVAATQTKAEALGLTDGALYDVRVCWLKPGGTASEYSLVENIRAVADPVKPATPEAPQASVSGLFVTVSGRAANDNTAYLSFWRATSVQAFGDAVNISGDLRVSANQVLAFADTPGVGAWRYWVQSRNGSGVPADVPAGPVSVTVVP